MARNAAMRDLAASPSSAEEEDGTWSKSGDDEKAQLPESMWSLVLVAAVGQARFTGGTAVSSMLIAILAFLMGCVQLFTIFLIVHDLNPHAKPITTPQTAAVGTPWVEKTWTVNSMKWIMITLLAMGLTSEAAQCEATLRSSIKVSHGQLNISRAVPIAMCIAQYTIVCGVVFGGVSVVLSCQAVPEILYNSLAITFIVGVDDLCCVFFSKCFALKLNFEIEFHGHTHDEDSAEEDEEHEMPPLIELLLNVMLTAPLGLAYIIAAIAYHTNIMPTDGWGIHQI